VIVAHLADLHLGHRAYGRSRRGRNLRERDVARAFRRSVQEILRLRPELILVAGDVFERPEPPATALVVLARALETLRSSLPDTQVLMVAGARDTPRSRSEPGALAALDTFSNVEAATGTARSVYLKGGEIHVLLLPHRAVLEEPRPELRPDPDARWNVLLAYGTVVEAGGDIGAGRRDRTETEDAEVVPRLDRTDAATADDRVGEGPSPLEVRAGDWDYVALGHDHRFRVVAPRVVYAGSLERVGPEPWTEAHRPKGFVVTDLETGDVSHRQIAGRPVVALAPIRWDPERPERMNERIREVSEEIPGGIDGRIVRLRLEGMGPAEFQRLDPELLSSLRSRAVHLAVEVESAPPRTPRPEPRAEVLGRLEAEGAEAEVLRQLAERLMDRGGRPGEALP